MPLGEKRKMKKSILFYLGLSLALLMIIFCGGYLLLYSQTENFEKEYRKVLFTGTQNLVEAQAQKVNAQLFAMKENVKVIASAGSMLYEARSKDAAFNNRLIKSFLMKTVSQFPAGKTSGGGSGLWYEPWVLNPDEKYVGPYAFWHEGELLYTLEYNDPAYDYPVQDWYTAAVPLDWDRKKQRDDSVYYSAPYRDSAGMNTMMLTLSSIMTAADGTIIGLSTLDITLKHASDAMKDLARELPGSYPFALDTRSRLVMAYPKDETRTLESIDTLGFHNAPDWKESSVFNTDIDGARCVVFYQVGETGIGIGVAIPEAVLYAKANQVHEDVMRTVYVTLGFFLIVAAAIFVMQIKIVCSPLKELALFVRQLEEGNLSARLKKRFCGELNILKDAMNALSSTLADAHQKAAREADKARDEAARAHEAMEQAVASQRAAESARREGMLAAAGQLEEVAGIVSSASTQLSAQIGQAGRGAADQASRVAETATAMEEMNGTVTEVARSAGQASDVSLKTREKAETGADIVRRTVDSIRQVREESLALKEDMAALDEHAKAISRIMAVISDIADQTNLLALNAAIEAARAGEAGRGFAVVADEVRKLAEKTVASTSDVDKAIKGIQDSAARSAGQVDRAVRVIEEATDHAGRSGEALREIVDLADNTADQVRAIATASEQQSSSSEEINRSIARISSIAGETAGAMDEADRAVTELAEQARALTNLIEDMKRA